MTFQKAFEKTGRAMNVSIAPAETHQTSRLLNATTSPSVLMRSAVMASAAVPGIFPPVTLQALDSDGQLKSYLPSRRWVDGSVSDDMPAKRLARLYGVNHYIVSQTNPHVLPFVTDGHRKQTSLGLLQNASRRATREWFNAVTLILDRADKKNGVITQATSLMRSIINQDYVGDINILPDYRLINPSKSARVSRGEAGAQVDRLGRTLYLAKTGDDPAANADQSHSQGDTTVLREGRCNLNKK